MTDSMLPIEHRTSPEQNQKPGKEAVSTAAGTSSESSMHVHLPRITIKFCTQCKWMLRAAYFGQELLSTFNNSLGEVALIPTTGGVFNVAIFHTSDDRLSTQETLLWDRKLHGGFPEVKQLKSLVRNIVDPARDLGHVDRALSKKTSHTGAETAPVPATVTRITATDGDKSTTACEDCQ